MAKKFYPVVLGDPHAYIVTRMLAAELSRDGTVECVKVCLATSLVRTQVIDKVSIGVRFLPVEEVTVESFASKLKSRALVLGATPEAIRLLRAFTPITKDEENFMAEKLKGKGKTSADTDGLKKGAKAAPVKTGGKAASAPKADAPKRRGNPEALAKARAARQTGPDTRKIKPLMKAKDLKAREGTFRRTMLEAALSSKTVQEFRDKDSKYDAGCLKHAIDTGVISVA